MALMYPLRSQHLLINTEIITSRFPTQLMNELPRRIQRILADTDFYGLTIINSSTRAYPTGSSTEKAINEKLIPVLEHLVGLKRVHLSSFFYIQCTLNWTEGSAHILVNVMLLWSFGTYYYVQSVPTLKVQVNLVTIRIPLKVIIVMEGYPDECPG